MSEALAVYTDGACRANGRPGARAGVGVYFGEGDPWNVSEPLPAEGGEQTNQRAEVWAIVRALQRLDERGVPAGREVVVYTDSAYCVNAYYRWIPRWERAAPPLTRR